MKHLSKEEFDDLQKFYRINLINSCTGYKSANLLGSISKEGVENVSVFSSITHLGSNPAMLGYILRPTTVPRDTFKNIKETGFFTVNHIFKDIISCTININNRIYIINCLIYDAAYCDPSKFNWHANSETNCRTRCV